MTRRTRCVCHKGEKNGVRNKNDIRGRNNVSVGRLSDRQSRESLSEKGICWINIVNLCVSRPYWNFGKSGKVGSELVRC